MDATLPPSAAEHLPPWAAEHLPPWAAEAVDAAQVAGTDVAAGLALAEQYGELLPPPGEGRTWARWSVLAAIAERELTAARILEAHSDALAILHEAGEAHPKGTWGVFAAESPTARLQATEAASAVSLTGTKPWCSLAGSIDHALVTAHVGRGRRLYAVDLDSPTVTVDPPERWVARGLATVTSGQVHFADTPGRPIGGLGWYLDRPGFAWGGIGVAACWYGGACGLYRSLRERCSAQAGELAALHVGIVDAALHGAGATLEHAAGLVDAGLAIGDAGQLLALRVRAVVADAVERTVRQVGHALGPAPLAFDERHARRVADLELYVRQHHAERDLASLGAAGIGAAGIDTTVSRTGHS
ncbi:MAG: acyl-CoA dehydrogenase [Actinomycetota bacterium]|nr:acyl-CoA dehydrogenase [Actinomycetota bacterium]